jgi:putative peptide zinc metalloprotease protein
MSETYPKLSNVKSIFPLDSISEEQEYLIILKNERKFKISSTLYTIIQYMDGTKSVNEIVDNVNEHYFLNISEEDVMRVIREYLVPNGILNDEEYEEKSSMNCKLVVSHKICSSLNKLFSIFFSKTLLFIITGATLFTHMIFYYHFFTLKANLVEISGFIYLKIYFLHLVSIFFHELGHSSACHYYNVNYGDIGVRFHHTIPYFMVNVDDSWILKRTDRVFVDAGGIYFQSIVSAFLIFLHVLNCEDFLMYGVFAINMNMLNNLLPYLRSDGYWILSDIFGIPNLSTRWKSHSVNTPQYRYSSNAKKKIFCVRLFFSLVFIFYHLGFLYAVIVLIPRFVTTFLEILDVSIHGILSGITGGNLLLGIEKSLQLLCPVLIVLRIIISLMGIICQIKVIILICFKKLLNYIEKIKKYL